MKRSVAILIGLLVALIAGIGVGTTSGSKAGAANVEWPASDRVDEAVASLRTDPFYVGPEMRHLLTAQQRSAISETLRENPEPVYLMFMHSTSNAGYYLDFSLLDRVAEQLGDGLYVTVDETMRDTSRDYGARFDYLFGVDLKTRPATGLMNMATAMAGAGVRERNPEAFDHWGGRGGGIAAGLLFGVGISIGVGLVVFTIALAGKAILRGGARA